MGSILKKPEFVLVPGAWHGPECFKPTADILKAKGYKVHGINLKSVGASPPLDDFQPDVEIIRNKVDSLLATSTPVIMVYHSYGGTVGSEALANYLNTLPTSTNPSCPSSPPGLIRRLFYIASFCLPKSTSLKTFLGDGPDWYVFSPDHKTVTCSAPYEIFYNDIEKMEAKKYVDALKEHSLNVFTSPVTAEPWRFIPSTYVVCEDDKAIPLKAQLGLIKQAQDIAAGSFDTIERTTSGHSPFISQPEWLAEKLIKAAETSV
ncbi:db0d3a80-74b1-41e9-887d-dba9a0fba3bb [Sclerotinia trifoliorum]|uniref:Db0d3a80-74b1-41e9-887d-dba9a0fba3bb n=1 Tax=Sclerotinia trifoliorum TaxID=28548 RepID=A0A8H2ZLA8_9HELO|nr:db0d3a80-74b1-41e9-887d-dba9a0fba3bb [Sclerotinia trifoliorum]